MKHLAWQRRHSSSVRNVSAPGTTVGVSTQWEGACTLRSPVRRRLTSAAVIARPNIQGQHTHTDRQRHWKTAARTWLHAPLIYISSGGPKIWAMGGCGKSYSPCFLPLSITSYSRSPFTLSALFISCNYVPLRWALPQIFTFCVNLAGYTIPSWYLNKPPRLTQPSHPSVGRRNEYWRWCRPLLGKKRRVLRNSRPCYQDCWHTGVVGWRRWPLMGPAIRSTWVVLVS